MRPPQAREHRIHVLILFRIRHCECIYYQGWHRTTPTRPGKDVLPNVAPDTRLPSKEEEAALQAATPKPNDYAQVPRAPGLAVLPSTRSQSQAPLGVRGVPIATAGPSAVMAEQQQQQVAPQKRGLPFDEECKLVYGVLFSLRSMMKKLSSKE